MCKVKTPPRHNNVLMTYNSCVENMADGSIGRFVRTEDDLWRVAFMNPVEINNGLL